MLFYRRGESAPAPFLYTDVFPTGMCHGFFPSLPRILCPPFLHRLPWAASANLSQFLWNPLPGRTRLEWGEEAENEERAVNHAGMVEAVGGRGEGGGAMDEMDRQVTKERKGVRQREWPVKSETDFSIFQWTHENVCFAVPSLILKLLNCLEYTCL